MPVLNIRLFGRPSFLASVQAPQTSHILDASKAQELFCFLLLNRERPLHRESLAALLWGECSTAQSKKYLRKTLWQLQSTLNAITALPDAGILWIEAEWIQVSEQADIWLDVANFEAAFEAVRGVLGAELEVRQFTRLRQAIELYRGALLEGYYQDWCLYERARYQEMYLAMLDKLMGYCEAHLMFEAGVAYGQMILRYDHARERTHRRLMRLYYLAGDRTTALRQFERCREILREELDVAPGARTLALFQRLKEDRRGMAGFTASSDADSQGATRSQAIALLARIRRLLRAGDAIQRQLPDEIQKLEDLLGDKED